MAATKQELETQVKISAKAEENGFAKAQDLINGLASTVGQLSDMLINFGKTSAEKYKSYEVNMAQAEIALATTYGQSTAELTNVMSNLDTAAQHWAETTIFHANDVSNAITLAARSGWDYEQIMVGLPAAMQLALAGNMDLSEAIDYVVKAQKAFGLTNEEVIPFINQWVYAANTSATSVAELGDTMLRMGATVRWASDPTEVLTMAAVMANFGTTGSQAGTLLRGTMIRLIAPTEKAADAMAELGATEEEISEIDMEGLEAAYELLSGYGFSPYDAEGRLRPMLDIFSDLAEILVQINGGSWDGLFENEKVNSIVSAIFPTRQIQAAQALILSSRNNYEDLQERLMSPDALNYAQYASEVMGDTWYAKEEAFNSKIEALEILVGEQLKPDLEAAAGFMGDLVEWVIALPEETFSAIVKGLEVIAIAGPGLALAGGALKVIASLGSLGGIGLALAGLVALVVAINDLEESKFENLFGDMNLDRGKYTAAIQGIGNEFDKAWESVSNFKTMLQETEAEYKTASQAFSQTLFEAVTLGREFTEQEQQALINQGMEMGRLVLQGMNQSYSKSTSYWTTLLGGGDPGDEDNPVLQGILDLTEDAYNESVADLERIGTGMRNAITSAFANDGKIDDEEYQEILEWMRAYNLAMARAAREARSDEDYVNQQELLRKAQTASFDEIDGILSEADEARQARIEEMETDFWHEYWLLQRAGADEATLKAAEDAFNEEKSKVNAEYRDLQGRIITSAVATSDYGDLYTTWVDAADKVMRGEIGPEALGSFDLYDPIQQGFNPTMMARLGNWMLRFLPTDEEIEALYNSGEVEQAQEMATRRIVARWFAGAAQQARTITEQGQYDWQMMADSASEYADIFEAPAPNLRRTGKYPRWTAQEGPEMEPADPAAMFRAYETARTEADKLRQIELDVGADVRPAMIDIEALEDETVTITVNGDLSGLYGALNDASGAVSDWFTENNARSRGYAEGGRATVASIFGEAGPEWAIPEEHSARTAALLDAARAASGFSWPELLAARGGLNADSGRIPTTIIYSPTVNAQDARGVEEVLRADKERLDRWFEEKQLRDSVEVYT